MLWVGVATLGVLGTLAGCNALNGTANLVEARTDSAQTEAGPGADAGSPSTTSKDAGSHPHDAHAPVDSSTSALDASEASVAEAGTGLCNGLAMVLRFDNVLSGAQGQQPTIVPSVAFAQGVYGQGVILDNAPLGYAGDHLSIESGTISAYIAGGWDANNEPCPGMLFWSLDGQPYSYCNNDGTHDMYGFGADNAPPQYAELYDNAPWNAGFNHVVATWSQSPPRLTFTVNGLTAESDATWSPGHTSIASILFADGSNQQSMLIDDVAVWTRALSTPEIAAVQAAGKSIADVCGLP